jgi:hypothetical protein
LVDSGVDEVRHPQSFLYEFDDDIWIVGLAKIIKATSIVRALYDVGHLVVGDENDRYVFGVGFQTNVTAEV